MLTQQEQNAIEQVREILENYEKYQGKVSYLIEDSNRKILFCNQSFCNMVGITTPPSDMIGYDCSNAAEDTKHLFINPDKFVEDINEILSNRDKKVTHIIEMIDGRKFRRDYVPLFFNNNYIAHSWQYYDI